MGRKLIALSRRLDLKTLKIISKARHCTINDIFISCIAGAIQSVDPSISRAKICFVFGSVMPGTFGVQNTISFVNFQADLTQETSVLRLRQISDILRRIKSSSLPLGIFFIISAISNHLPEFIWNLFSDFTSSTFCCSCLRGPDCEYSTVGDYVTDLSFIPMNVGKSSKYCN